MAQKCPTRQNAIACTIQNSAEYFNFHYLGDNDNNLLNIFKNGKDRSCTNEKIWVYSMVVEKLRFVMWGIFSYSGYVRITHSHTRSICSKSLQIRIITQPETQKGGSERKKLDFHQTKPNRSKTNIVGLLAHIASGFVLEMAYYVMSDDTLNHTHSGLWCGGPTVVQDSASPVNV